LDKLLSQLHFIMTSSYPIYFSFNSPERKKYYNKPNFNILIFVCVITRKNGCLIPCWKSKIQDFWMWVFNYCLMYTKAEIFGCLLVLCCSFFSFFFLKIPFLGSPLSLRSVIKCWQPDSYFIYFFLVQTITWYREKQHCSEEKKDTLLFRWYIPKVFFKISFRKSYLILV